MGCVCCSLSSFVSIILHAFERITLCTVCAMLTCCLLCTIMCVLVMGIGIGFHYCTVQNSVEAMEKAALAAGAVRRSGGDQKPLLRSLNSAVKEGFAHRLGKRGLAGELMPSNNNTINDAIIAGNITIQNTTDFNSQNVSTILGGQAKIRLKREIASAIVGNNSIFNQSIYNVFVNLMESKNSFNDSVSHLVNKTLVEIIQ